MKKLFFGNSKIAKILIIFIFSFIIVLGLKDSSVKAATVSSPSQLPIGLQGAIASYDSSCHNNPNKYKLDAYLSSQNNPSVDLSQLQVVRGASYNLQINYVIFVCNDLVGTYGDSYPATPLPRNGALTTAAALFQAEFELSNLSVSGLNGTCSGSFSASLPEHTFLTPPNSSNARYWFGSYPFTYNAPSGSNCSGSANIIANTKELNYFHKNSPVIKCGNQTSTQYPNSIDDCNSNNNSFQINLTSPPIIYSSCKNSNFRINYTDNNGEYSYFYNINGSNSGGGLISPGSPGFSISMSNQNQLNQNTLSILIVDRGGNTLLSANNIIYPACYVPNCGTLPAQSFTLGSRFNLSASVIFTPTVVPNPASPGSTPTNIGTNNINPFYIKQGSVRVDNSGIVGSPSLAAAKYVQRDSFSSANLKSGNFDIFWGFPGISGLCSSPNQDALIGKPFLSVNGGDVITGTKIGAAIGSCTDTVISSDPDGILTWNTNSPSFKGSGTTMAAQALGQIIGFVSNQNSTTTGNELTFANIGSGIGGSIYGGLFGTAPCGPDLSSYSSITPSSNPGTISSVNSGATAYSSDLQISNLNISNSTQATIYTTGNIYITSDIKYNTTGWTDPSKIPNLKIIAKNIYIDSGVHQLDGIYIATGDIKDCANNTGAFQDTSCFANVSSPINQLTVNGSFMANQIYLQRTGGNIYPTSSMSTPIPAETFNYSPEEWLAPVGSQQGRLTALFSLSPTL